MVPTDLLPSANSLKSISIDAMQFIGPAIGAFIIALGGTSLAFALDGCCFIISALCLVALPRVAILRLPVEKEAGMLQDMREGIRAVLDSPWLWITLVVASVSTIFLVGPYEAALPLLVKQRFGERVGFYALFTSLSALGSIIAAFWLGRFKRLRRRGLLTYGAWLVTSLMLLAVGLTLSVGGVSVATFIQGVAFVALAWPGRIPYKSSSRLVCWGVFQVLIC
jgi:hypothetical protein